MSNMSYRFRSALLGLSCVTLFACEAPTRPSGQQVELSTTLHAETLDGGFQFPSGAGMTEQGGWLFIRPQAGDHYGPVALAGKVHLTSLEGSGNRKLCVDGNNAVYTCTDDLAALRLEIQQLRATVSALSNR
jgi:hypothetical protein